MENAQADKATSTTSQTEQTGSSNLDATSKDAGTDAINPVTAATSPPSVKSSKKGKCRKSAHKKCKPVKARKKSRTTKGEASSDDSDSDDSDSSSSDSTSSSASSVSESSDSSDEEDEDEDKDDTRRKSKSSKRSKRATKKSKSSKKGRKSKKAVSESDDEDSDEESSNASDSNDESDRRKSSRKKSSSRKTRKHHDSESESDADDDTDSGDERRLSLSELKKQLAKAVKQKSSKHRRFGHKSHSSKRKGAHKADALQYKRVDELWDNSIHNYKLRESAEGDESEFAEYAFLVRRTFDWENKYRDTVVDIKAKPLRAALYDVMKDCKSVSLEADEPALDPKTLFLYLEPLRTHYKKTLKAKIKAERKRKVIKRLEQQRALLKMLVQYIDEDYESTKKTLYPLLRSGNITFDLLWALFQPNDIAVTSCYGVWDEPRCFKVEYTNKCASMTRGEWYCIEGLYTEYDGKGFGTGDFEVDIDSFKGPRKITSLATYPLRYHKDAERVKKQILERGERFVNMEGMHYKFHKGLAFMKKKKQILKININGRVMVDPSTFRRINPNYPISVIKAKGMDDLWSDSCGEDDDDDDDCSCCGGESDEDGSVTEEKALEQNDRDVEKPRYKYKWMNNERGRLVLTAVEVDEDGEPLQSQNLTSRFATHPDLRTKVFTEEELLLTSPVVLGFAFSEKLWLEFTLSGIHEIVYNDAAFSSLVLPPNQKSIVRALVESHKQHSARTIDDVVQGKGKGLVAVLHGPPGTGKTLTAEGISELLRCPLYMVSAGELGTDPSRLEHELQKILDIAHSWGAVLLLDEADVFLEKREVHDIHRNALVSIFLRLLEYFQGILFLTTNRVETFDDAFQSRIHVALRYGDLSHAAKKSVWKMFIEMVRGVEGMQVERLGDEDIDALARHTLNGRQIKNVVRTAQALALNEKATLGLEHIRRVLDVAETFDRDLKGGTGYLDAMRSYT